MTKAIRILLAATLLVGAALAAGAQELRVEVPFDFIVQGKTLPAGTYTVARVLERNPALMAIRTTDGGARALVNVGLDSYKPGASLTFRRYADSYYLSAITTASGKYDLPVTREERMTAAKQASTPVIVGSN